MHIKHYILLITVMLATGCASPFLEDNSKDALIAYIVRQNVINEQRLREQDKIDAVKQFQMQAIRAGFAHWDVDITGKVEFKWIGQKRK